MDEYDDSQTDSEKLGCLLCLAFPTFFLLAVVWQALKTLVGAP